MRRAVLFALVFTIPVYVFLNIWQGFRFEEMAKRVQQMEREQNEWFERNKYLMASIAIYSSPVRIEQLAPQLDLHRIDQSRVLRVQVGERREGRSDD